MKTWLCAQRKLSARGVNPSTPSEKRIAILRLTCEDGLNSIDSEAIRQNALAANQIA